MIEDVRMQCLCMYVFMSASVGMYECASACEQYN